MTEQFYIISSIIIQCGDLQNSNSEKLSSLSLESVFPMFNVSSLK